MSENVKVVVRCRPLNRKENESKCENIVEINEYAISVLNPSARNSQKKMFTFDSVYDMISKTEVIYNEMCYSLVESTLDGYNGTIFAYGQTGCGKTHTMQGDGSAKDGYNCGIIPRCFEHIFETISMATNIRYLALVSYLEIYNENIRDLLSDSTGIMNHPLKEMPGVGVTVPTLTTQPVINAKQCYYWLKLGNKNRVTATTLMNEQSSRSHTIFTISLEQFQGPSSSSVSSIASGDIMGGIRRGKLSLVDLAGSERQRKTGAQGSRFKEATKINLSLSALGNVISSLVDSKSKHVPYRDSKLTRLLQDSLGGNTKTLMISCISPADSNYDETLSTLRYASRAKNISNKPKINEDPKDAQLRQYQSEILHLKRMLEESEQKIFRRKDKDNNIIQLSHINSDLQSPSADLYIANMNFPTPKPEIDYLSQLNKPKVSESSDELQLQARNRIDFIKRTLIGGERANDLQLRERHRVRKIAAQRHLSAIANALSRVESEDRDLLQGHYASITQEINIKNEHIRICRQKIKMLEREVADLNSEFQLDREDYLDEIRNLGRNIKFFQQLFSKVQPILRRNGKNWCPTVILENSFWNDDLKVWRIPDTDTLKLPPAHLIPDFQRINSSGIGDIKNSKYIEKNTNIASVKNDEKDSDNSDIAKETYNVNILQNYFRSTRQKNMDYEPSTNRTKKFYAETDIMSTKTNIPMATQLKKLVYPVKETTDHPDLSKIDNRLGQEKIIN
ncbi:osmotic avoidance abnormal protein 3 isoform X1 [Drosophila persimilis]|uniref:osmotic avoidance abnormal protein 3 isoform X1 n=1 Tax=Drosophila persimilis TaxID=7234 RepID=UPI000F080C2E|nr:osmotic avoidance abnormal protein 3 isoform X1 [Drosophila persimilis]